MKKLVITIIILFIIFVVLLIYRTNNMPTQPITAQTVNEIEEYISKIYMWKEITGEALPKFEDINKAPENWIWQVVKKNIDDYEDITREEIHEKAKEIFGEKLQLQLPEKGNESFIYQEETNTYEANRDRARYR